MADRCFCYAGPAEKDLIQMLQILLKRYRFDEKRLAEAQRDLTAEQAAERLRALPESHYRAE